MNLTPGLAAATSTATLTGGDRLAIVSYFGILLCGAWGFIGASIFASNIDSEQIGRKN